MELEHEFTVAAPVDKAWDVLLDLDTIVPCMPGAALTAYDGDTFDGTVKVKLGPVSMTFAGKGRFVERDEANRRVVVEAAGKDARGGGTAKATVRATLTPSADPASTDVHVHTDMAVTGRVAQFGRSMISDVSGRLLGQFTDCLQGKLAGAPAATATSAGATASAAAPAAAGAVAAGAPAGTAASGGAAPTAVNGRAEALPGADTSFHGTTPAERAIPGQLDAERRQASAAEVEPVDLLAVTGVSAAARRVLPYAGVFVLGAVVGGVIVRWLS